MIPGLRVAAALIAILTLMSATLAVQAGSELGVGTITGPSGTYTTLQSALDNAADGDTITVDGGVHAGGFVVNNSVSLRGVGWPVLDGGGTGTVLSPSRTRTCP